MNILIILFLSFILQASSNKNKQQNTFSLQNKETSVTFLIPEDQARGKEVVKLTLRLEKDDPSLVDAIEKAQLLQKQIREIFEDFCFEVSEPQLQDECEQMIESDEYQIEAQYYKLRGKELFKTFHVRFEMILKIRALKLIGYLVDEYSQLIQNGDIVMRDIDWQDTVEQIKQESILEAGVSKAKSSCINLGMDLLKIKSVEVWEKPPQQIKKMKSIPKDEDDEEEEEQEEEQQVENQSSNNQDTLKYKFVVVCKKKPSKQNTQTKKKRLQQL